MSTEAVKKLMPLLFPIFTVIHIKRTRWYPRYILRNSHWGNSCRQIHNRPWTRYIQRIADLRESCFRGIHIYSIEY